jgi:hypothetical protein
LLINELVKSNPRQQRKKKKIIWHKELLAAKMKFYVLGLADKPAKAHKTIFAPNNIYRVLLNGWEQISG